MFPRATRQDGASDYRHLIVGKRYVVAQPFEDYDGTLHEPGETFTYRDYHFVAYHDGLTLYIEPGGSIRLCQTPYDQGPIIDALAQYIVEA